MGTGDLGPVARRRDGRTVSGAGTPGGGSGTWPTATAGRRVRARERRSGDVDSRLFPAAVAVRWSCPVLRDGAARRAHTTGLTRPATPQSHPLHGRCATARRPGPAALHKPHHTGGFGHRRVGEQLHVPAPHK